MEISTSYNFYCGTSRGFLASTLWRYRKGKDDTDVPKPYYNIDHKGDDISSFEFGRSINEIVIGTVKGNIRLYDVLSRSYSPFGIICTSEPSEVVGSEIIQDNLIYCQKNGIVTFWHPEQERSTNFTIPVGEGQSIRRFRRNEYRDDLFCVAGHKFEYALWDMEKRKVVFAAKSLPADQLYQLPQTTIATDLCTLNFGGGHVGAVVTAEGVTMLYDDRAQRRPVFILKKESKGGAHTSFTCIKSAIGLDHLLAAGTSRGAVHLIDIRVKKSYIGAITGYNGAVTSLAPLGLGSESAMASTCLDGNLRVHCITTKKLLYKIYLKVGLKGVLTQPINLQQIELKMDENKMVENADLDNIFASMETIDDSNNYGSNIEHENGKDLNEKTKSHKPTKCENKAHAEMVVDEIEKKTPEIKPTELQRLWKQDIATLISTDPFKRHVEYLLSKEIKIEDESEIEQNKRIIEEILGDNNKNMKQKKLKRKNDISFEDENVDGSTKELNTNRNKSQNTKTKLKGLSIIEVGNKIKVSKNFDKKKSKKTLIKIKGEIE